MATGKFSRRITVNRASTSDELKAYLISLDYGQQLTQSFIHTKTLANNVFVLTVGLDVQEVYTPRYTRSAVMKKPTAQVSLPFSLLSLMCTQDNYIDIACYSVLDINCNSVWHTSLLFPAIWFNFLVVGRWVDRLAPLEAGAFLQLSSRVSSYVYLCAQEWDFIASALACWFMQRSKTGERKRSENLATIGASIRLCILLRTHSDVF